MKTIFDKLVDILLSPLSLNIDSLTDTHGELFTEITRSIFLGSRPDEASTRELKKAGITHVVSCLDEEERSSVEFLKQDFHHLFLAVHDGMYEDITGQLRQFFDFTGDFNNRKTRSKLLVHCEVGVSRSPTFVIAQLMKLESKRFFDIYKSVKLRRGQILPNIGFASQLQQLENVLLGMEQSGSPSSLARYLKQVCNLPAEIELIQSILESNRYDAVASIMAIFGGEIPRVIQGAKL